MTSLNIARGASFFFYKTLKTLRAQTYNIKRRRMHQNSINHARDVPGGGGGGYDVSLYIMELYKMFEELRKFELTNHSARNHSSKKYFPVTRFHGK